MECVCVSRDNRGHGTSGELWANGLASSSRRGGGNLCKTEWKDACSDRVTEASDGRTALCEVRCGEKKSEANTQRWKRPRRDNGRKSNKEGTGIEMGSRSI